MKFWTNLNKDFVYMTYIDEFGNDCVEKICRQLWNILVKKPLDFK